MSPVSPTFDGMYLHTAMPRKHLFYMGKDASVSKFVYDRFRDGAVGLRFGS